MQTVASRATIKGIMHMECLTDSLIKGFNYIVGWEEKGREEDYYILVPTVRRLQKRSIEIPC